MIGTVRSLLYIDILWISDHQYFFILLALLILVLAGAIVAMSQGIDKLADPFMDTLSRYQRGRHGTLEQTWDDVQTQVISTLIFVIN